MQHAQSGRSMHFSPYVDPSLGLAANLWQPLERILAFLAFWCTPRGSGVSIPEIHVSSALGLVTFRTSVSRCWQQVRLGTESLDHNCTPHFIVLMLIGDLNGVNFRGSSPICTLAANQEFRICDIRCAHCTPLINKDACFCGFQQAVGQIEQCSL